MSLMKARARAETGRVAEAQPVDTLACAAYGCPLRGSVSPGSSGRFYCHCHAWANADDWPRITREIREHDWLVGFAGDLRVPRKDWRDYAATFWTNDAHMVPAASETQHDYWTRLLQELEHRVGVRKQRPHPRGPREFAAPGNLGSFVSRRAA